MAQDVCRNEPLPSIEQLYGFAEPMSARKMADHCLVELTDFDGQVEVRLRSLMRGPVEIPMPRRWASKVDSVDRGRGTVGDDEPAHTDSTG